MCADLKSREVSTMMQLFLKKRQRICEPDHLTLLLNSLSVNLQIRRTLLLLRRKYFKLITQIGKQ